MATDNCPVELNDIDGEAYFDVTKHTDKDLWGPPQFGLRNPRTTLN